MSKESDLYDDQIEEPIEIGSNPRTIDPLKEYELGIDTESSIINLSGDILYGKTLLEITSKIRLLLKVRHLAKEQASINLIINSNGGSPSETLGIIDYIKSLDVSVNTICRGEISGTAVGLFQAATGKRFMSKRSTLKLGDRLVTADIALKEQLIDYIIQDKVITKS
jgi:ATP-dependent protease ClpP protease subunit